MVADTDIARWRLRSQGLDRPSASGPGDVVSSLLCVQAENPSQSAWAVATRTAEPDGSALAGALADGTIIRTHVLRPTWHYVGADDLTWLQAVTSDRVRRTTVQALRRTHGLSESEHARVDGLVLDALAGGRHLTRPQIADVLAGAGTPLDGQPLMLLMGDLELRTLVCSGAPADEVHTYALVADRVPGTRTMERGDALGELARRYFTGHGPATEADLAYWATLTVTDVRAGLAVARPDLESFEHDGRTFWHAPGQSPPTAPPDPPAHLLQILDELYRGYQDSRWVLDAAGAIPRQREAAIGMAVVDGQLVASMKRSLTTVRVTFDLSPLASWTPSMLAPVEAAAARYGRFLDREPVVRFR